MISCKRGAIMATSARDSILRRLRSSTDQYVQIPPLPGNKNSQDKSQVDPRLKDNLIGKLKANHMEVHSAGLRQQQRLIEDLSNQGLRRWITGSSPRCQPLVEKLKQQAEVEVTPFSKEFEDLKAQIFDHIDVGLTSSCIGIAETGTLVLQPGPDEPRTLSLIPPVHVILFNPTNIYVNLDDFFYTLPDEELSERSNLLFVSSPSKTADIQQTLAYGAHGPKRVIVLLEED